MHIAQKHGRPPILVMAIACRKLAVSVIIGDESVERLPADIKKRCNNIAIGMGPLDDARR